MRAMIPVEEALRIVGSATARSRPRGEVVAIADALGRVLASDVRMDHDAPPFHRASMDGYAVRAADVEPSSLPRHLPVVAHVTAGTSAPRPLAAGEAMAVMTGAPLPADADTVIPIEWTSEPDAPRGRESRTRIDRSAPVGSNVSRRGESAREGEVVAEAGSPVTPALVGVLAAAGRTRVEVAVLPRVRILATGDELVVAQRRPGPSQIRDSNGHALLAQVRAAGGAGTYAGPVVDEPAALRAAIEAACAADVVLVTGGVSVGEKDFVPAILAELGVERLFHRWSVKPGGPLWFGRRGDTLVFALPGNPAAAFAGFELLVVPAIRARLGRPFAARATVRARLAAPLPAPIPRRQYVPVRLDLASSPVSATPVRWSGSGDPFGLARAQGFAAVPARDEAPAASDGGVDVVPFVGTALGAEA